MHRNPMLSGLRPPTTRGGVAIQPPLRPRYIHIRIDQQPIRWRPGAGLTITLVFSLALWAAVIFAARALLGL
jgi:hypothetical protein